MFRPLFVAPPGELAPLVNGYPNLWGGASDEVLYIMTGKKKNHQERSPGPASSASKGVY